MARWSYVTLDHASFVDFARCLGERFRLLAGGEEICEVQLASVTPLRSKSFGSPEGRRHQSFRLLFIAPHQWRHPQSIYRLAHPRLGELGLFLVPIGPDARGMKLEAIFNYG